MKRKFLGIPEFLFVFLILSFLVQIRILPAVERVSVQVILSNPERYAGHEVTLQGKAYKIKPRTSKSGNDYTAFRLKDNSGKSINILSRGYPLLAEGQKVIVTGIYRKTERIGRHTFHGVVDARNIVR